MKSDATARFWVALISILFVLTFFFIAGVSRTNADDSCPDIPTCGGESLEYSFTDHSTGQPISDGATVPLNTLVYIDALATAYGACAPYIWDCSSTPCTCIPDTVYERTVNHIDYDMYAITEGGLNGNYSVGNTFCWDENHYTAFYHVAESRTETCPYGGSVNLSAPGIYNFSIVNHINNLLCLEGLCPETVEATATLYVGEPAVNSDCNVLVGKGVSAASGVVVAEETDFTVQGIMPIKFTRYHNSKKAETLVRSFGQTWAHNFDTKIDTNSASNLFKATEPDGSSVYYSDINADTVYEAVLPKAETSRLVKNLDNTFTRAFKDGTTQSFNSAGYLTAVTDRNGNSISLTRDGSNKLTTITDPGGKVISLTYDTSNRVSQITPPDSNPITYTYSSNTLQKVTYPGGAYRQYDYFMKHLTGIKNENGNYVKKYTYELSYLKAITASADGTNEKITLNYVDGTHTTVTDSLGRVTTYTHDKSGGKNTAVTIEGPGCKECGQGATAYTYDSNLNITSTTDGNGNVIVFTYDANGNMLTKTEAYGTALQRTTTYTYNQFSQVLTVTDPGNNVTTNVYDSNGNLLSTTDAQNNVTSYTYDARGLKTSMTDPRGNTTTYAYDQYGNLTTITDALDNTTNFTYDTMGRILTKTDANSNTTTYEYNTRGWLTKVTDPTTGFTTNAYNSAGSLLSVTDQAGNITSYTYDNIGRVTKVTDPGNNTLNYTYDSQSNRLSLTIKNSSNTTTMSETYTYDDYNRLARKIHSDSTYAENTYDSNGNLVSKRDENGNNYSYVIDALNRTTSVTDPLSGVISYTYDSRNNLATVTDPNNNTTTYTYDSINRLLSVASPDAGTSTFTSDQNGNLLTKTDANNVTVTYTYDELNRKTLVEFPDSSQNVAYTYDNCPNGINRLCEMTDPSGTTDYEYNSMGKFTKETKVIGGVNYVTQYTYALNGNILTMTYPSTRVITYNYTNGRVTGVLNNGTPIASNIAYKPFWGVSSLSFGNGLTQTTNYDLRYQITSIVNGSVQNLSYGYDNNGNILSITNSLNPPRNKTFTYNALNRLATAAGQWGPITYTYDGVGNRLTEITGQGSTDYTYTGNRLSSSTGEKVFAFTYDSNGNAINDNLKQYVYDQSQRLITAIDNGNTVGEYLYNGKGERVAKANLSGTVVFHYDITGKLIGESTDLGATLAEYVNLKGTPFAKIEGTNVYYYHNDHLGTPQKMTNSASTVVWDGEFRPFGEPYSVTGSVMNNLRFPGQYYDEETGLNYNYYRDYKPNIGRYLEADSIGLLGGPNLFVYVQNNPINWIDPWGLYIGQLPPAPPGYDPNTWASGRYPSGKYWVQDPEGARWIMHPEDKGHWRHWEDPGGRQWPPNAKKRWPTQKRPTQCDQSEVDPSGDAPSWGPNELTITDPFALENIFIYPVNPGMPRVPYPGGIPIRVPAPVLP